MAELWGFDTDTIYPFTLAFARVLSIVLLAPVLGSRSVPWAARLGLALFLALALAPLAPAGARPALPGLLGLGLDLAHEVFVGIVMGLVATLVFAAVQFAGNLVGLQIGFGIVNVIDPQSETQVSLLSQFQDLLAVVIFLTVDGHHLILRALTRSLTLVPLGWGGTPSALWELFVRKSGDIFVNGIMLAAPALVCLFATTAALGFVARAVPQINVFIVGFPLQIGVGLLVVSLSLPLFHFVLRRLFVGLDGDLAAVVRLLARS